MKRAFSVLAPLGLSAIAQAQTGLPVAGFGYQLPGKTITAAPGQIMSVSVFGISARIPEPLFPVATNGFPTEVNGISVDFVQGLLTVQLPVRGVQQSTCPPSGTCSPATTLTIQIPFEFNPDSHVEALLRVKEAGKPVAEAVLNGVTDAVHVINTCDQLGVFLSIATDVPPQVCAPIVMHARGPLVSNSAPATPGETIVLWAYGLGALERPIPDTCCSTPEQLPEVSQPFTVTFSYVDVGRFPWRRLGAATPSYVGMVGGGLYQVQFAVPAVPSNISPCFGRTGNLKIMVTGPNSADGAEVCVQP